MPSAVDLTTAANAAAELGIAPDSPGLARMITAASTAIAKWLGYRLDRRLDYESLPSSSGPWLFLKAGAIQRIDLVTFRGQELPSSSYRLEDPIRGRIVGTGFPFTGSSSIGVAPQELHTYDTGDLVVSYSAGWVTPGLAALGGPDPVDLPADIEQAALEVIVAWWRRRGRDGDLDSVNLGAGSLQYVDGKQAIPVTARSLLVHYRKRIA